MLVTGGAGFIGSHLGRALVARDHEVDLADSFVRGRLDEDLRDLEGSPRVRLLRLDLLDDSAFEALDRDYGAVIHLAAVVGVANVLGDPWKTLHDNVEMTRRVLRWARELPGLERFMFASTSEIYAGTAATSALPVPTPEDVALCFPDVADPRRTYAISKLCGEALCHHADIPFTIVRPHNVYGPRMGLSHVIPELLERAHAAPAGGSLSVYSPEHRRTFCFVDDAVELLVRAIEADAAAGATLNVGSEEPEVSIADLARLICDVVGKDLAVRGLAATRGSPARRRPDMTRAERLLGYRAQTGLRDGVDRTYGWYREHVFGRPIAGLR